MKKKGRLFTLIALIAICAIAAVGLAGCGSSSSGDSSTLRFVGQDYPGGNLDPSYMDNSGWQLERLGIGETLFKFNAKSKVVPWLAKSYTVSDDNKTWTITLNSGIKFSNGHKMTATAVKNSLQRLYDEEKAGNGTAAPSNYIPVSSITADDDANTVTIVTSGDTYTNVATALTNPRFCILDTNSGKSYSSNPICTGPYAVKSIKKKKSYTLTKNKNYWDGDVPFETVVFTCSEDSSAKAMALENGDQDVAENITSSTDLKEIKDNDDYGVKEVTGTRTAYTYMNMAEGRPLANKSLRKAINTAMDDKTFCNKTVGGLYEAGVGILPTSIDYGSSDVKDTTAYSLKKARKILDDANIKDTDGDGYRELDGENIELTYLTYENRNLHEFAEAQAESMKKIGINCKVTKTDSDTQWNKMTAGDFDLGNQNWNVMQSGDPQVFMNNFVTDNENNYGKYSSTEYDNLYKQLSTTTDTAARKKIFTQLQQILENDAVVIENGYYNSNICWNKSNVTGVTYQAMDYYWITKDIKPAS